MGVMLTIIHVLACLVLVLVVLLQTGKGADMGALFGGSSQTIFGSSGAGNFLTRLTTGAAVVFMLTSLSLTYLSSHRLTSSVFDASMPEPPPIQEPVGEANAPSTGSVEVIPAGAGDQGAAPPPAAGEQAQAEAPAPAAEGQAAQPD